MTEPVVISHDRRRLLEYLGAQIWILPFNCFPNYIVLSRWLHSQLLFSTPPNALKYQASVRGPQYDLLAIEENKYLYKKYSLHIISRSFRAQTIYRLHPGAL
jgi:hypothetical protein